MLFNNFCSFVFKTNLRDNCLTHSLIPPQPFSELLNELGIIISIPDVPGDFGNVG